MFAAVRQIKSCQMTNMQAPHIPQFIGKTFISDGVMNMWCNTDNDQTDLVTCEVTPELKTTRQTTTDKIKLSDKSNQRT